MVIKSVGLLCFLFQFNRTTIYDKNLEFKSICSVCFGSVFCSRKPPRISRPGNTFVPPQIKRYPAAGHLCYCGGSFMLPRRVNHLILATTRKSICTPAKKHTQLWKIRFATRKKKVCLNKLDRLYAVPTIGRYRYVLFYSSVNSFFPIRLPSANISTRYVPGDRYSSIVQYMVTLTSSPSYSMFLRIE